MCETAVPVSQGGRVLHRLLSAVKPKFRGCYLGDLLQKMQESAASIGVRFVAVSMQINAISQR